MVIDRLCGVKFSGFGHRGFLRHPAIASESCHDDWNVRKSRTQLARAENDRFPTLSDVTNT